VPGMCRRYIPESRILSPAVSCRVFLRAAPRVLGVPGRVSRHRRLRFMVQRAGRGADLGDYVRVIRFLTEYGLDSPPLPATHFNPGNVPIQVKVAPENYHI
jgi:hypothetical protein